MKTDSPMTSDSNLPEGGVFADIGHLIATAPPDHPMHQAEDKEALAPWSLLGGCSFPDIDVWSRGGLNE